MLMKMISFTCINSKDKNDCNEKRIEISIELDNLFKLFARAKNEFNS